MPIAAPAGSAPGSRVTSTSHGSARCGTAAITKPSSSSAGRSFAQCTATSIVAALQGVEDRVDPQALQSLRGVGGRRALVAGGRHRARSRRRRRGRPAAAGPPRPARAPASSGGCRSAGRSLGDVGVDAEQVREQPRVRALRCRARCAPSAPRSGRAAASPRCPRASCSTAARSSGVRSARCEACRVELGLQDLVAARAQRRDDGRERVGTPADRVPADLLGDDLVRAHDLVGRPLVAVGQPLAQRHDVDQRGARRARPTAGSTSRGTARSTSTSGRRLAPAARRPRARRPRPRRRSR